jgi:hypothetical protein
MIGQKPDLKEDITVQTGVVTASQLAGRNSAARGLRRTVNAARAFGVTLGPSVIFDLLLGAAAVGTLTGRLRLHPLTSRERAVRDLTILGGITLAAYLLAFRPWMQGWGATKDEKRKGLPGDEQVLNPWKSSTRAITVHAPVEKVWPWLAQIGQDRGGFYSYHWLENLAGCHIRNAGTIHPEWQCREISEVVKLLRRGANGPPILSRDRPHPDGRTRAEPLRCPADRAAPLPDGKKNAQRHQEAGRTACRGIFDVSSHVTITPPR